MNTVFALQRRMTPVRHSTLCCYWIPGGQTWTTNTAWVQRLSVQQLVQRTVLHSMRSITAADNRELAACVTPPPASGRTDGYVMLLGASRSTPLWRATSARDVTFKQMILGHLQTRLHADSLGGTVNSSRIHVAGAGLIWLPGVQSARTGRRRSLLTNYVVIWFGNSLCDLFSNDLTTTKRPARA